MIYAIVVCVIYCLFFIMFISNISVNYVRIFKINEHLFIISFLQHHSRSQTSEGSGKKTNVQPRPRPKTASM